MLPEYDFSHAVRGRHADRFAEGTNLVVLERDVWEEFPDSERVNEALRKLMKARRERTLDSMQELLVPESKKTGTANGRRRKKTG